MLYEADIQAIVRLLGEVSVAHGDLAQKRQLLLIELCELIDADTWAWSLCQRADKRRAAICLDRTAGCRRSTNSAPALLARVDCTSQARLTVQQISDDVVSSITMGRQMGRPPFAPREIKMAKIVLSEIPWLHEKHAPAGSKRLGAALSPRERATLVHLIDGLSREAIAERLQLSPHTVHGYIKEIYKYYRVNSRAGLMKHFTLGWQQAT